MSATWHAAAAALLFVSLCSMTGCLWRSFVVAALFSLHPLQVESVAWAAERSNVLAGFFFALTLLLWARYVRCPNAGRYAMVLASVTLGLMAKPILMTLPFVLLLLDTWPLGRLLSRGPSPTKFATAKLGRLLLEKAPMIGISAVSGLIAIVAHRQVVAELKPSQILPLGFRLGNAALSYWRYLGKMFWPADLAMLYPHPGRQIPAGPAVLAGLLLVTLTVLVLWQRRRPWLAVGWLWYVGMLVPMIGIVAFGSQAMADRFMYLPSIGCSMALVWLIMEALPLRRFRPTLIVALTASVLCALAVKTVMQERLWKDSETLFRHTLALTSNNYLIHNNLGDVLLNAGRYPEAIAEYEKALIAIPDVHTNLGIALLNAGRLDEAIRHFQAALRLQPGNPKYLYILEQARSMAIQKGSTGFSTSNGGVRSRSPEEVERQK